ncbi:MAG: DUF167 family protein [Pikeienuella sp.]
MIRVRLTPKGGRDRIDGVGMAGGRAVLQVRVAAAPVGGAANAALLTLLAKALGRPKTAARLAAGATARLKTVEVAGDPAELADRCRAAFAAEGRAAPRPLP